MLEAVGLLALAVAVARSINWYQRRREDRKRSRLKIVVGARQGRAAAIAYPALDERPELDLSAIDHQLAHSPPGPAA